MTAWLDENCRTRERLPNVSDPISYIQNPCLLDPIPCQMAFFGVGAEDALD